MARGDGELQGPEERRASKLSIAPRHSGCTLNFTVSEAEFRVATRTFRLRALSLLTPPAEPFTGQYRNADVLLAHRQIRRLNDGNALANIRGEAVAAVRLSGTIGDPAQRAQLLECEALIQAPHAVDIRGQIAGEQQAIAPRQMAHDALHHVINQRGAVDGNGVVETRRIDQAASLLDVAEEQGAHRRLWHANAVQIVVFTADIGAHPDDVALIGRDDAEAVPLEETAELRIGRILAATYFDREGDVLAVIETKRYQHVRNGPAVPVRHDHVDRRELVEIVAAGFPALRVVGVAAPVEVADISQRHVVAVDRTVGDLRDIVCPEPLVGRCNALPPDE